MKKTTISVTEAARNFADCVNRAHYQNVTFVLIKNGVPVARLVPDNEKVCTGRELAEALERTELTAEDTKAWRRDLQAARARPSTPRLTNGDSSRRRRSHPRRKGFLRSEALVGDSLRRPS